MQIDSHELERALRALLAERAVLAATDAADFLKGYFEPELQTGSQPVLLPSDQFQTAPQTSSRPVLADRQTGQSVRLVMRTPDWSGPDRASRPPGEARFIELVRMGWSGNKAAERVRSEGHTLNRNRLKALRQEALTD